MKLNFFGKKIEQKSLPRSATATCFVDNWGNITGTIFSTSKDEIRKNASVNTIISKQSSIVNEAELIAKEKSDKMDIVSANKDVLTFLSWLNKPNSSPSPTKISDIFKHLISENYKAGVSGMVFVFSKTLSMSTFKHIKLARELDVAIISNKVVYNVSIGPLTNSVRFEWDSERLNYVHENQDEVMILFVCGNFDVNKGEYRSDFEGIYPYILLQNYLISFATNFHKNACFPSMIVQMTYKNLETGAILSEKQQKDFEDAVDQVKRQLVQSKGVDNSGNMIVPKHPSLEIQVIPLSIPTNASDNVAYHGLATDKIFSLVDGGSSAAFEGKSEYANNASAKLQDLYDGTFRMANLVIVESLTQFMQNLLTVMRSKGNIEKTYLYLNISGIKIYQKQILTEVTMLSQNNIITINQAQKVIANVKEDYADLTGNNPKYDVMNAELGGKQSQAPNVK